MDERSIKPVAKKVVLMFLLRNNMLPKNKRVTKDIFQIILKKGNMLSGSLFVLRYLPQETPQFAVVAPKSVAKRAVLRNKLRRQGYNVLRALKPQNGLAILMYKKFNEVPNSKDILSDIKALLIRAKIL